jgi:hypothetical protein
VDGIIPWAVPQAIPGFGPDPTIQWIKIAERLIYNSPPILEKLKFSRCRRRL